MAINWTEAQVAELVAKVVSEIRSGSPAPATENWSSTQYNGRKLIGVYATMEEAIAAAQKLKDCTVKLTAKAGNGGRLFGAVTTKEIAEGLKAQFGLDIPKQKLVLDEPIKAFGTYEVKAKLGFEVSGVVKVTVTEA